MEDRRRRRKTSEQSNSEGSEGEDTHNVKEKQEEKVSESEQAATLIEDDDIDDECEYETETYDDETESYDEDETTEAGTELTEDERGELADEEVLEGGQEEWLEERQRGDGQEQPAAETENVDDDEDSKNPAYIPRRGAFYEHDNRLGEEEECGGERGEEAETEEGEEGGDGIKSKKQLWTESKKWDHDRYSEEQQQPKSREEIISIYGYDIRAHSEPPEASPVRSSRGRRGGGGGRRSQRLQDFIPQNENQNGRPTYNSLRSRDDQDVEYDQGGRGYRPRGGSRGGRGPPPPRQQHQQRGGRHRQNDTPPRSSRSSKPTRIIESDSYIDEDMIPPMTTPYTTSPAAQPMQSNVDQPKERTSGKPMAPGGYSQEDLLNIMPPTTTIPTSSRSSISHAKRYSSQRQRNPPEQNAPPQHEQTPPLSQGHHNGNRNHQPPAQFYNSVYHHQRYPMPGPQHPSSRGMPPRGSSPRVSSQPASFTPPLTSVTMASHPVLHTPFIGPPAAVMNYGHPGTVPTTVTSAPFPLATMPLQAPLPSNAQPPDGIHVRGGTTYFNPESQPNLLSQTNQEGIEVRGGTTYFNPESQAFTPAPLVVPVPQNKRAKAAIPIVEPQPLPQHGFHQYDFDPEAPEYHPDEYYDTDPEVGSWCEGKEREGSRTPVNQAELAQGLSDIQINNGTNAPPAPATVEPT
ncbi:hypothetical protein CAPTEDRAFT_226679 [Capitella teleta]|uniref:Protein CASC3 n=1 Tax=Capitella teleta TaxID=283909 RepID=R7U247_CAPTE|nr:hypothetical protein CAPTEDRAFT_226679 [Capitella teleta]|eukprot:ELT97736.1 hypothetical protein CAPTEDRAFT_226679 [Capitella teleta]